MNVAASKVCALQCDSAKCVYEYERAHACACMCACVLSVYFSKFEEFDVASLVIATQIAALMHPGRSCLILCQFYQKFVFPHQ